MSKNNQPQFHRNQCNVTLSKKKLRISIPKALYGGKARFVHSGLRDTSPNRAEVQRAADLMNGDILRGEFDFSLVRYKGMITPDGLAESNQGNYQEAIAGVHYTMLAVIWSDWIQSLNLSEETYNNHHKWVERWVFTFDPEWDDVTWVYSITNCPKTVNSYLIYIRKCIDWALEEGLIKGKNPYKNLSIKDKSVKEKRKGFTEEEKERILEEFKNPTIDHTPTKLITRYYHPMIEFWFMTGLRVGEVISLKWGDIDEENNQIIIRRSLSRDHSNEGKGHIRIEKTTKTGKERVLPITREINEILDKMSTYQFPVYGLIFPKMNNNPVDIDNWRRRVWKPVLERAGVPYQPPKNIRHTLLTEAANDPRIGVVGAAKIAGHTTTRTVQDNYIGLHGDVILPSSE